MSGPLPQADPVIANSKNAMPTKVGAFIWLISLPRSNKGHSVRPFAGLAFEAASALRLASRPASHFILPHGPPRLVPNRSLLNSLAVRVGRQCVLGGRSPRRGG